MSFLNSLFIVLFITAVIAVFYCIMRFALWFIDKHMEALFTNKNNKDEK